MNLKVGPNTQFFWGPKYPPKASEYILGYLRVSQIISWLKIMEPTSIFYSFKFKVCQYSNFVGAPISQAWAWQIISWLANMNKFHLFNSVSVSSSFFNGVDYPFNRIHFPNVDIKFFFHFIRIKHRISRPGCTFFHILLAARVGFRQVSSTKA